MTTHPLRVPLTSWQRWGLGGFALVFMATLWLVVTAFGTLQEDNRRYEHASITLTAATNVQRETLLILTEAARHVPQRELALRRDFLANQVGMVRARTTDVPAVHAPLRRFERELARLDELIAVGSDFHDGSFGVAADDVELAAKHLYDIIETGFLDGLRLAARGRAQLRTALVAFGVATAALGAALTLSIRRRLRSKFVDAYRELEHALQERARSQTAVAEHAQRVHEYARQLEHANAELLRADAMKDQFLSVVSHELRTPLAAVIGFTHTLRRHGERLSAEQRAAFLERIAAQAERQNRLVDDLLMTSQIVHGRIPVAPVAANVGDLLEQCRSTTVLDWDQVAITGDLRAPVHVDPDHFQQLITNLVNNAFKYGAPPIEIEVRAYDEATEVTVTDLGPGLPDEFVPVMWEPFTQASGGDQRTSAGVGLGLAITRAITDANQGTIAYDRGPGARFTVRLPNRPAGSRASEPAVPATAVTSS